jgi:hypothetical protein
MVYNNLKEKENRKEKRIFSIIYNSKFFSFYSLINFDNGWFT